MHTDLLVGMRVYVCGEVEYGRQTEGTGGKRSVYLMATVIEPVKSPRSEQLKKEALNAGYGLAERRRKHLE